MRLKSPSEVDHQKSIGSLKPFRTQSGRPCRPSPPANKAGRLPLLVGVNACKHVKAMDEGENVALEARLAGRCQCMHDLQILSHLGTEKPWSAGCRSPGATKKGDLAGPVHQQTKDEGFDANHRHLLAQKHLDLQCLSKQGGSLPCSDTFLRTTLSSQSTCRYNNCYCQTGVL
jgi:hypothetical protein